MTKFSDDIDRPVGALGSVGLNQDNASLLVKCKSLRSVPSVAPDSVFEIGILTLNVQHASPARSHKQAQWLSNRKDADVVVLTEVAAGKHAHTLVTGLELSGYKVVIPADVSGQYRVLVASRAGAVEPGMFTAPIKQRLLSVQVIVGEAAFDLIGVYVPSRGPANQRNVAKRLFQRTLSDLLLSHADAFRCGQSTVVVAGDMNVVEPDHVPFHRVFGQWEYDFYRSFERSGLTDAFRHLNPTRVEHSWYGRKRGSGYRFDHIFTNRPDALVSCKYVQEPRTLGLSDHAAMVAVLKLVQPDPLGSDPSNPAAVSHVETRPQLGRDCPT
jgi:exodeoxyribonuclease-3